MQHPYPRSSVHPSRFDRWTAPLLTPWGSAVLMLLVALAARAVQFGNPVIQTDDQFYLLVGDRMLHGALPYLDIWDRKPVGLFVIYAAIRLLGGDGVLAYQLVATVFATATGWVLARIARPFASAHGAAAVGVIYIVYLGVFGGDGGQSPVFYNLLVALAAWSVARVVEAPGFGARDALLGVLAVALMGVAMQVKYTALFEGAYFGLALIWAAWRARVPLPAIAALALLWFALAVAPTLAAWAVYAHWGYGPLFFDANFVSIFTRHPEPAGRVLLRLLRMLAGLAPLGVAALLAWRYRPAEARRYRFVVGWAVAACVGVLLFGSYFDHYMLPLLGPLAVTAAPFLSQRETGVAVVAGERRWCMPASLFLVIFAVAVSASVINENRRVRGWGPQLAAMTDYLRPRLRDCLYVYQGDVALYRTTNSCLPTRWPFPNHLNYAREDGAIGVDTMAEVRRIMARHPQFVVSGDLADRQVNQRTWDYMQGELGRDYRPVLWKRIGSQNYSIYQRLPGH